MDDEMILIIAELETLSSRITLLSDIVEMNRQAVEGQIQFLYGALAGLKERVDDDG